MEPPDLYSAHAETIESALVHACRSHRLAPDAADEFCSWARVKLLDHDQAILRKFQQRSQLRTFLITVVQRLFLDWRNAEWGKWRPTADARRVGAVAIELERLVTRDQFTFGEAVQTLVTRGKATADECEAAWVQLPRRPRRRRVGEDDLSSVASNARASDHVEDDEARRSSLRLAEALEWAVRALPAADQVMLQMRYWSGFTVARIALMSGENQKALYRRFERLSAQLRRELEAQGVSAEAVAAFSSRFTDAPDEGVGAPLGNVAFGPSTVASTGGEHA